MKAAVYYKKNDLRVMDIPMPELGDRDVLVKVKYCGVCGTDVHIFHGDGGAAPVPEGTVIGHEFSGVVDKVGRLVERVQVGDRVTVNPNEFCGECYYCDNGMQHFCTNMKGYGTTYNGGFAEYVAVPDKQVYKLPDSIDFQTGSQSETLSCCLNGIDLCRLKAGANVFILGAGPIGLMMLQLARMDGAGKIVVSELVPEKREIALKLGADVAFDPREQDIQTVLDREFENIDCVIEAAGAKVTTEQAIQFAGKGCTVMLFGLVSPDTEISIKPYSIFQRELNLTASFINPYTFDRSVRVLGSGRVKMDDIITDIVPLDEINRVFTEEHFRKCGKILIQMPE